MFTIEGKIRWSASDLTAAAECEYGVLRRVDVRLGRATAVQVPEDPLMRQVARLGGDHEARILQDLKMSGINVVELDRAGTPYSEERLGAMQAATIDAFAGDPDAVFQAGFYDGEFLGYADFIERSEKGWVVCDAKLARHARPKALLQLGAYADQLMSAGLDVAPHATLLLGSGQPEEFPLTDILPVFRERRARLRQILAEHQSETGPVPWGDERYVACGRCPECLEAVTKHDDLIQVARLRMDQRQKLRKVGIRTVHELAAAEACPPGMAAEPFDALRAQAALQVSQMDAGPGPDGREQVSYELTAGATVTLVLLPAPSPGDMFFDFEGDPLYNEGDLTRWGLEYLWGVMEAPAAGQSSGTFTPLWAHNTSQEMAAFQQFMDLVAKRRADHPDLHIYHYAPYETTALKRLAARYQSHEEELDDLLRSAVFVDLYATVRGAVRVSQPSYSIKKLEPLYMGADELRTGDVQAGDVSIVEYHEYRHLIEGGDGPRAEAKLRTLADYNEYDCLSTLRLRDWLLSLAEECGVADLITPRGVHREGERDEERDATHLALMAKAGPDNRLARTNDQQAYAMLAAAQGYYRRESLPFWWAHFERLGAPIEEWGDQRDVFRVRRAVVEQDWQTTGRQTNPRRTLRLVGEWGPGSTPGNQVRPVYEIPTPPGADPPEACVLGAGADTSVTYVENDDSTVLLVESVRAGDTHGELPVALVPAPPPNPRAIEDAIREVAEQAASAPGLPSRAATDILLRRPPRLRSGQNLPSSRSCLDDVVAALLDLDASYVAVQGPPGSGKTFTGSRVIARLVQEHQWRIGVVAQSHAVVENMLAAVVDAGLDPALVGKSKNSSDLVTWTDVPNSKRSKFLDENAGSGCVIGGTAWTFAAQSLIEREGLDLLVIDEAGQFALAPTIGASVAAQRLLLLGDPQQLPQVSQGTHPEPVDVSALGWLMDGHDTIPAELGYFLGTTYRMHPALCDKVSVLSYDGRLGADRCTARRSLSGVEPGLDVIRVNHEQNRTSSIEEAGETVTQVRRLIGTPWSDGESRARPLQESDFRVVAPYNAQVHLIRRELAEAGFRRVPVGTVDKFQGQEAPVVIVSMTASSHGDVPRGMGFLLNRNRVNVAVSRAQWLAVLIRSDALTSYMPTTPHALLEEGAFIGLCDV